MQQDIHPEFPQQNISCSLAPSPGGGESPAASSVASPCTPSTSSKTITTTESSCQSRGAAQMIQTSGSLNHGFCKSSALRLAKNNNSPIHRFSVREPEVFNTPHGLGSTQGTITQHALESNEAKVCDVEPSSGFSGNDSIVNSMFEGENAQEEHNPISAVTVQNDSSQTQKMTMSEAPHLRPSDRTSFLEIKEGAYSIGEQEGDSSLRNSAAWPSDGELLQSMKGTKLQCNGGTANTGNFWGRASGPHNSLHSTQQQQQQQQQQQPGDRCCTRRNETNVGSLSESGSCIGNHPAQNFRMNNRRSLIPTPSFVIKNFTEGGYRGGSSNEKGNWSFDRRRGGGLHNMSSGSLHNQARGSHGARESNGSNSHNNSYYKRNCLGVGRNVNANNQGGSWKYPSRQGQSRFNVQQVQDLFIKRSLNVLYEYKEQEAQKQCRDGTSESCPNANIRCVELGASQVPYISGEDFLLRLQQSFAQIWGAPMCSVNENAPVNTSISGVSSGVHSHDIPTHVHSHSHYYHHHHHHHHHQNHQMNFTRHRVSVDSLYPSGYINVGSSSTASYPYINCRPPASNNSQMIEGSTFCNIDSGGNPVEGFSQIPLAMPMSTLVPSYAMPRFNTGCTIEGSVAYQDKSPRRTHSSTNVTECVNMSKATISQNGVSVTGDLNTDSMTQLNVTGVSSDTYDPLAIQSNLPQDSSVQASEHVPPPPSQPTLPPAQALLPNAQPHSLTQYSQYSHVQQTFTPYHSYSHQPRFSQPQQQQYIYLQYPQSSSSRQHQQQHSRAPHHPHQDMHQKLPRYHNYTYQPDGSASVFGGNTGLELKGDMNSSYNTSAGNEDEEKGPVPPLGKETSRVLRNQRHQSISSGQQVHQEISSSFTSPNGNVRMNNVPYIVSISGSGNQPPNHSTYKRSP